ncbi:hypothetical protein F01_420332 [Burkholderia cenocepacia]|nr:hypothetical protein F01_420332 [Burkholderia cenocepacia]
MGLAALGRPRRDRAARAGDRTCARAGVRAAGGRRRFPLFERPRPVRLRGRHRESGRRRRGGRRDRDGAGRGARRLELRRGAAVGTRLRPDGAHSVGRDGSHHRAPPFGQRGTRRRTRIRAREAHRAGKLRARGVHAAPFVAVVGRASRGPLLRRVRLLVPRVRRADAPDERRGRRDRRRPVPLHAAADGRVFLVPADEGRQAGPVRARTVSAGRDR